MVIVDLHFEAAATGEDASCGTLSSDKRIHVNPPVRNGGDSVPLAGKRAGHSASAPTSPAVARTTRPTPPVYGKWGRGRERNGGETKRSSERSRERAIQGECSRSSLNSETMLRF